MLSKRHSLFLLFFLSVLLGWTQPKSKELLKLQELIDSTEYSEAKDLAYSFLNEPSKKEHWYYVHSKLGDIQYYLGDMKLSLGHYLKAIAQEEINKPENLRTLEETNSYIGFAYRQFGLEKRAEQWFRKALEQAIFLQDSAEIAVCYYNISTVLLAQGRLDASMEMLKRAYEIDLVRSDTSAIGFDLKMMGEAQMKLGLPEKAVSYFKQSISLLQQSTGNRNSLGNRYELLSDAFAAMSNWDSAVYYSNLAISDYTDHGDSLDLANQWVNRAHIALGEKNNREAIEWGMRAKAYFQSLEPSSSLVSANEVLSQAYIQSGRHQQALALIRTNQSLAIELALPLELQSGYEKEASLLEKMGETAQALAVLKKSRALEDSLDDQRKALLVEEMQVRYAVDQMERENELLKMENQVALAEVTRKNTFIKALYLIGFLILIFGTALIWFIVTRNKLKAEALQAEVNELRVRIKGVLEFKPEQVGVVKDQINKSLQEPLSDREFEILNLALSNKSNAEIADQVFVTVNTVKYHLKNIYSKLGVSDRKEALKYVFQTSDN